MMQPDFRKFADEGYTRVPVVLEARADLYTPLAVYLKLADGPYTYLLESVVGGERFGRYSFIGLACAERIEARGGTIRRLLRDARGNDVCLERIENADPYAFVRDSLHRQRVAPVPQALRFGGGLVGYFGYETVQHVEPNALKVGKPDAIGTPDLLLLVSDELAVVDNVMGKLYLVVYADPRDPEAHATANARLAKLRARLASPLPEELLESDKSPSGGTPDAKLTRSFSEAQFLEAVRRSKEYIFAGDCMQVQISQRTSRPFDAPPISLYRALRSLNPSPYMFYFDFADHQVVGASPEIMVRLSGNEITLRPIAGLSNGLVVAHRRIRGLLDLDVLAGAQRLQREIEVELRRDRDDHRIDVRIVDRIRVIGIAARAAELTAERRRLRLVAAGVAADDLALEPPQVAAVHARDEAAAEKGNAEG